MRLSTTLLAVTLCLLVAGSSAVFAASEIVFIGKGDQAHLLEQYFEADPEINLTIVYSENLFDTDSPYFTPEAMASYDAIILGEVVIGDSLNGSLVMEPSLQEAIRERVAAGRGLPTSADGAPIRVAIQTGAASGTVPQSLRSCLCIFLQSGIPTMTGAPRL